MWFNFCRCRVYAISIYWSNLVIRKEIMYNFYKKASKTSSTLLSSNLIPFHLKRRHCKGTYCYLCKYKTIHLVFSVTCRLNYLSESPPPVHNTGSPHCRHKTFNLTGHVSLVSLNILIFQPTIRSKVILKEKTHQVDIPDRWLFTPVEGSNVCLVTVSVTTTINVACISSDITPTST